MKPKLNITCFKNIFDDAFSIETGLELTRIVGSIRCFWMSGSSIEIRNKGSAGVRPLLSDA